MNFERFHSFFLRLAFACGMLRASDSIIAIVCSVAARVLPSGALATMIPFRVAASTSILSTPTPARPMNFSFFAGLDHLCVDIGAAAHQQGIVVPDDFAELVFLEIGSDIHVNDRPQDNEALLPPADR